MQSFPVCLTACNSVRVDALRPLGIYATIIRRNLLRPPYTMELKFRLPGTGIKNWPNKGYCKIFLRRYWQNILIFCQYLLRLPLIWPMLDNFGSSYRKPELKFRRVRRPLEVPLKTPPQIPKPSMRSLRKISRNYVTERFKENITELWYRSLKREYHGTMVPIALKRISRNYATLKVLDDVDTG